ncbi:MAG: GWxTD domain-containing protein [Bacteroidota bacterium]
MHWKYCWLVSLFLLPLAGFAQEQEDLVFYMDLYRYQSTFSDTPSAMIYLALDGSSVGYELREDETYHPNTKGTLDLYRLKGEDTMKVYHANVVFDFNGTGLADTTLESKRTTLLNDVELRFLPGKYLAVAQLQDMTKAESEASSIFREFEIKRLPKNEFGFSDLKWVSRKESPKGRGFGRKDFLPLVTNDYFLNQDTMRFYLEFYHTDLLMEDRFFIRSVIYQGDQRIWTTETTEERKVARSFNAYVESMYIAKLRSNTYYLQVELLAPNLKTVKTYRKKFYVYNSRLDAEYEATVNASAPEIEIFNRYQEQELDYYIATLMYKATEQEKNFARILETYDQKKNFLYSFFAKRNDNRPQKVIAQWKGHLLALDYVNENFDSSLRDGWQTDRGRVFLQYGIPNDIERFPGESTTVPYEIWRYNRVGAQTNIVFIFFDPDLALNEYPLLHSNKYGEINNPRWQSMLVGKGRVPSELDYERTNSGFPNSKLNLDDN